MTYITLPLQVAGYTLYTVINKSRQGMLEQKRIASAIH